MTWKVKLCGKTYMVLDDEGWYVMSCQDEQRAQLVASAPQMQEALRTIAEGAIVSSDQAPEKIAEQVLRVLRIAREAAAEYTIWAGMQQKRAERAEAALKMVWRTRQSASYEEINEAGITGYSFYLTESQCTKISAAIAAAKGGHS